MGVPARKINTCETQGDNFADLKNNLKNKWWRLNNLYWIVDKFGQRVKFRCNFAQVELFRSMWHQNLILKARQIGFTTLIDLWILDECLFVNNFEAGIIAHTREDAGKIFRRKIKYPYDNLPEWLKSARKAEVSSKTEMIFSNGSVVSVGTSMRSGTLQAIHISEFGKICVKYPEKAREIVSGSLETIAPGQKVFIESTAEGQQGYFYQYCQQAEKLAAGGKKLTPLDFKFFFFPWWQNPDNRIDPQTVVIPDKFQDYFAKIEAECDVALTPQQKAWYVKKHNRLGDDMKREHPSTPKEAFEQSVEGAYFERQFRKIYAENRITSVPVQSGVAVHTWWDLGMDDATAIWFVQVIGREVHLVDFYQNEGEGLQYYKDVLDEKGYTYGRHLAPHDIRARELGTGVTRLETAERLGIVFEVVPRVEKKIDAINAARDLLDICWFDEEKCNEGIIHLENYRKEWDEHRGRYKSTPLHDEHSDAADAFQTGAWGGINLLTGGARAKAQEVYSSEGMGAFL